MRALAVIPFLLILACAGLSYAGILPAMIGWGLCALSVISTSKWTLVCHHRYRTVHSYCAFGFPFC